MFISEQLLTTINQMLSHSDLLKDPLVVTSAVGGGSINNCYRMHAGGDTYFLKVNSEHQYPDMFQKEATGLKLLHSTGTVNVPQVIGFGASEGQQFLLLEWIDRGPATAAGQEELGRCLAALHRHSSSSFGLEYSNYMGALIQSNHFHSKWPRFFIEERLEPQVKIASDKNLLSSRDKALFESLYKNLEGLFPIEMPALIHGDLWSGNYVIDIKGNPYLIDPAVAFSNRECDIAMSKLFGGFDQCFYDSYNDTYSLQAGWEGRIDLLNLYPLLIHLNLFGNSYLPAVERTLKQYT